jgi:Flp pilus assembly protein TadD
VDLSGGKDWRSLSMLGAAYFQSGRAADAVQATRRALDVAVRENNAEAAKNLRAAIERYQQTEALPRRN